MACVQERARMGAARSHQFGARPPHAYPGPFKNDVHSYVYIYIYIHTHIAMYLYIIYIYIYVLYVCVYIYIYIYT